MRVCEFCKEAFCPASTGRPPKYCSATCRKDAHLKRKTDEIVVAAVARAVAAERRRSNRGNETRNRGNETPAAVPPRPAVPPPAAVSWQRLADMVGPEQSGGDLSGGPLLLPFDGEESGG